MQQVETPRKPSTGLKRFVADRHLNNGALVETPRKPSTGLKQVLYIRTRAIGRVETPRKPSTGLKQADELEARDDVDVETPRKPSTGLKQSVVDLDAIQEQRRDAQKTQIKIEKLQGDQLRANYALTLLEVREYSIYNR